MKSVVNDLNPSLKGFKEVGDFGMGLMGHGNTRLDVDIGSS